MARIAIYADALSAETSSVPSREMLLHLTKIRSADDFVFVFLKGGNEEGWWGEFEDRLPPGVAWSKHVGSVSRRHAHLRTLLGARFQPDCAVEADVYLRLDVGTMGLTGLPLIQLVADLSAIRIREQSSLKWHGRALFRRYLRDGALLASRTVCISQATASDVEDAVPRLKGRLAVIPNGMADPWLSEIKGDFAARGLGGRPFFLWYGHVSPRKNLERLLEAYGQFVERGGEQDLVIISGGAGRLRQRVSSLGLSERVGLRAPEPLAQLVDIASCADGVLLPSLYEGFGMPIIEAFARGVPVLTSERSSMPEIAGGLAVLCDPESTASIADGLATLARPDQRAADVAANRRAYAAEFTSEAAARRYSALIDEVLFGRCGGERHGE